ncbi:MAG: LytTR family DNA-binding domain-containing protein [Pseudomonadota bacterium]
MLEVLLIDDEPLARDLLMRWLREVDGLTVVGAASTLDQAQRMVTERSPNVVLLDVNLAGENGFGLLDAIDEARPPAIIFVTAYSDYAIDAFRVGAVDYLKKPFNREHLERALDRARHWLAAPRSNDAPAEHDHEQAKRLQIRDGGVITYVPAEGIQWIESAGGYCVIHTGDRRYVLREALQQLEQRLGDQFVRVHRSAVVNVSFLRSIEPIKRGDAMLSLSCGAQIRMSRRYRDALVAQMEARE